MRIEIYSDVVCPWCYIGERRFARALADFEAAGEVAVVFRAFQLDPAAPQAPVPLREYLENRYGPRARPMLVQASEAAAAEGIEIDWDHALAVNTRNAHRLLGLAAREYGEEVQRALAEELFALHFTRGGNVSDPDALADAAAAVEMDREDARAYLDSGAGHHEVDEEIAAAVHLGIHAVPTFIFDGRYAAQGAQPVSAFRRALEELRRREPPTAGN